MCVFFSPPVWVWLLHYRIKIITFYTISWHCLKSPTSLDVAAVDLPLSFTDFPLSIWRLFFQEQLHTIKLSLLHHVLSAVCGSYNFRVVTTHNRVSPRTKFSREGADGKILGKMRRNFLLSTFLSRVLVMYRHYQHCKISLKIFYWTYKNIWMKYERLIYIFINTSGTGS